MGDAMFGLADVESTLPAWVGTAAATLRNMMKKAYVVIRRVSSIAIRVVCRCGWAAGVRGGWYRWRSGYGEVKCKSTSATS